MRITSTAITALLSLLAAADTVNSFVHHPPSVPFIKTKTNVNKQQKLTNLHSEPSFDALTPVSGFESFETTATPSFGATSPPTATTTTTTTSEEKDGGVDAKEKELAQKAEATARSLLETRLAIEAMEKEVKAAGTVETEVEEQVEVESPAVVAEEDTTGAAEEDVEVVEEPEEPEEEEKKDESPAKEEPAVVAEKEISEPSVETTETTPTTATIATPEAPKEEEKKVEVKEPSSSSSPATIPTNLSIVPINEDSIEFTSGLVAGAAGLALGGPTAAIAAALIANYLSRDKDSDNRASSLVQGLSKSVIEFYNTVASIENEYKLLDKTRDVSKSALDKIKSLEGVDEKTVEKVEGTVSGTVKKIGELNEELGLVDSAGQVLGVIGDLFETSVTKLKGFNEEMQVTDRAVDVIKSGVDSVKKEEKKEEK